ncbi:SDR family NAD(P)-dependent oxidoreductase [Conexibacter sp. CPCC 206217]|uniref:SDR family NAD(P)-dependent oxidoreductase n=1 Tax=Conexibacter sp. CPCC 206217 TaxID=3064574 RepID=UPI0027215B49|nr:SDR family NAD(P)-dependent oxidoreductase [Conexibacter sp. CPCC 206217]MDO8209950.1 SDR family NAD(P)-dependent oxidoreductase [Conexibacter sp. CPCC 206217]
MIAETMTATLAGTTPLLAGRTVILTGAGGGIGRAIAHALAAAGARVALTDLRQEPLDALAGQLADGQILARAIDASDPAAFAAFHDETAAALGPVDGLVNCAGTFEKRAFDELDAAAWARSLTANLLTTVAGCQAVLPGMIARGCGAVVNVASTAGEYGSISPASHYAAAKGGVIGLTKSLAREAAPAQVRVNAVSPGPVETDGLLAVTPEQKAIAGSRTLFGRLGQPEEIAGACIFLLCPLSTFVTGHVLRVNGGALL